MEIAFSTSQFKAGLGNVLLKEAITKRGVLIVIEMFFFVLWVDFYFQQS